MTSSRTPAVDPPTCVRAAWSAEAVEALKALWADPDLSAADVARRLGVTRNAVLGKIHRLGLSKPRASRSSARWTPAHPSARPPRRRAKPPPTRAPVAPQSGMPEPVAPLVPHLEDLPPRACRWPIGDPRDPAFGFCGRPAAGGPYCVAHAAVAYRGPGVKVAELAKLLRR